MSALRPISSDS